MTRHEAEEAALALIALCAWALENAPDDAGVSLHMGAYSTRLLRDVLLELLEDQP